LTAIYTPAAKRLADIFHDKRDKNNPAVRDQTGKTIAAASEVNRVMIDHRFTDKLQRDWDLLRSVWTRWRGFTISHLWKAR
jgi:hypothetical protein